MEQVEGAGGGGGGKTLVCTVVQQSNEKMLLPLSPFQIARLKVLSEEPDIYAKLARSLAPSIWELDDIKKGLLCQVSC